VPFKSANLKLIYEEIRDSGRPIDAQELARLFKTGELLHLLRHAEDRHRLIKAYLLQRKRVENRLRNPHITKEERERLEELRNALSRLRHELLKDIDERETWY